jgi:hypothetical protein
MPRHLLKMYLVEESMGDNMGLYDKCLNNNFRCVSIPINASSPNAADWMVFLGLRPIPRVYLANDLPNN